MTKAQLVATIKENTGFQVTTIENIVDCMLETISEEISRGNGVSLSNFGTFVVKHRAPRVGRNPHTGETVNIEKRVVPVFKPSSKLKERVLCYDAEYNH